MALSANTVYEVRTTGAGTNGGGFVTGASGTDWSQQDAAQYAVTDAVTNGTTTVTSATASFGTDVVGNILYIQGGTGGITAGWYQIISRTNSTTIVLDRSTGLTTGTGATLNIGGCFASPVTAEAIMVAGNITWVKSGTYTITATLNFDAGNTLPNAVMTYMIGYETTRGDRPMGTGRPLIDTSSALNPMVRVNVGPRLFAHFRLDGTDTAINGIIMGDGGNVRGAQVAHCKIERTSTYGIDAGSGTYISGPVIGCEVTDMKAGATAGINQGFCVACYVHDSPGAGYNYPISAVGCVADTMASDGFRIGGLNGSQILNNIAYNNGGDGFESADTYSAHFAIMNNISYLNTGFGLRTDKTHPIDSAIIDYNAFGSNTSGARNTPGFIAGPNDVTLTADPFVDAPNGNFALNDTAGGGALLKALGYPGVFPGGLTVGYPDIGAAQHQDTIYANLDDDAADDVLTQLQSTFPASSILDIYDAAGPADPNSAHSGNILVSITLPPSPWGTPSAGSMAKANTWSGTAGATGTPLSARLRNAADTKRMDFTCTGPTGNGEIVLDTATITTGYAVTIDTFSILA